jgi:Zn-dependent peptidase ImmA (M78 family)
VGVKPELIAKKYYRLAGGTVPVNLERLCRRFGFEIVEWPGPPDFTSLLSVPHRIIAANKNMLIVRRRFSVAHELGHYGLGQAGVQFFGRYSKSERLANIFAARLLMPRPVVISIWSVLARTVEPFQWRVKLLAHRFGVSVAAARVRLEEIGII